MSWLFGALFLAAIAVQVWTRTSRDAQDALITKAKTMFNAARNAGQRAYDFIFRRRTAYRRAFLDARGELSAEGRIIIAHLAKFCRATTTKGIAAPGAHGVDVNATLIAVGRNEVFQVIMRELRIDPARVYQTVIDEDALAAA